MIKSFKYFKNILDVVCNLIQENNELLREMGWTVLRFRESFIKKDIQKCVKIIEENMP